MTYRMESSVFLESWRRAAFHRKSAKYGCRILNSSRYATLHICKVDELITTFDSIQLGFLNDLSLFLEQLQNYGSAVSFTGRICPLDPKIWRIKFEVFSGQTLSMCVSCLWMHDRNWIITRNSLYSWTTLASWPSSSVLWALCGFLNIHQPNVSRQSGYSL